MNHQSAIKFLIEHQPMPDDDKLQTSEIEKYDQIRKLFKENPNKDCLDYFFGSFGKGDGFGVYQLIEDTVLEHDPDDVIPKLAKALEKGSQSNMYWCVQIASNYSDSRLANGLKRALSIGSRDTREAAVIALERIEDEETISTLTAHLKSEVDEDIILLIDEIIKK